MELEIRFLHTNEMSNNVELAVTHFEQNKFFTG
jgi:hypothetical protein